MINPAWWVAMEGGAMVGQIERLKGDLTRLKDKLELLR